MTDRERVSKLNDLIWGLDDKGVLLAEDIRAWDEIMCDPAIEVYNISVIHIENLGVQLREMWIDHEKEWLAVHAHTKYIYDMTQHEIDTVIGFGDIIDCAITLQANGNTILTIETTDEKYDFYFENQENGLAVYQILAKYLVKRD